MFKFYNFLRKKIKNIFVEFLKKIEHGLTYKLLMQNGSSQHFLCGMDQLNLNTKWTYANRFLIHTFTP